jgi:hypothetical protein
MIEMAVQSDIPIDEFVDNKDEMVIYWEKEIVRMEQEIYNVTHMLPWVWGMADVQKKDEIKPTIIQNLESRGR